LHHGKSTPEEESRALANGYLASWSSDNETAFRDMRGLFGSRVNYFGRSLDREAVFTTKRRFAERWPVRSYRHRPGTMRVRCDGEECWVRSIVDWEAASQSRKARARGAIRFELAIDFSGAQPVVRAEKAVNLAGLTAKPSTGERSAAPEHPRPGRQVRKRLPLQLPVALLPDDTVAEDGSEEILLPEN
jgi:hypothetical protein